MKKKTQRKVLADHAKIGKRFVPPFIRLLGKPTDAPWVDVTLPELIWIACLNHKSGFARGAALAVALSRATKEAVPESTSWFASVSSYASLSAAQRAAVAAGLEKTTELFGLRAGLFDLQALYPEAPFAFLYGASTPTHSNRTEALTDFKSMLVGIFDKTTRQAIFTQGTAVYLGFVCGKLFVRKDTSLADFPALENYPDTEKSQMVAAAVRSTIPMVLLASPGSHDPQWPEYFWNRGLELEPCKPTHGDDTHESPET